MIQTRLLRVGLFTGTLFVVLFVWTRPASSFQGSDPLLTIVVDPSEGECFRSDNADNGEKVTAAIHVASNSMPIRGGLFAVQYDPSCLKFNSAAGIGLFETILDPIVNNPAGVVVFAVEMAAGSLPPNSDENVADLSFLKYGDCNSCEICFTNVDPYLTFLANDAGQRIAVVTSCSDIIRASNVVRLSTPGNITTSVDCGRSAGVGTWPAPSATDTCGTAQVFCRGKHENGMQYDEPTVLGGGEFEIGVSNFCCYAVSDYCGTFVGCPPDTTCPLGIDGMPEGCWEVRVYDETSLDITLELSPTSQGIPGVGLTRCIKFTLYTDCDVLEPLWFYDDVTFGGLYEFVGKSNSKVKVPYGNWACITAQDQLHTLRSCYSFVAGDCVGGQLKAHFKDDPRLGGNWLIGGNLDGWKKFDLNADPSLDVIDILDYGTFMSQYLTNYCDDPLYVACPNTPCGTPGPNADINGDGVVDMADYAFVSMNFLASSKECCCGPQTAGVNAITEISVAQLRAMGLDELIVADLNGDGLLNLADMAAFDQGYRPRGKKNDRIPKSSR